ncbi:hypothetical protein AB0D74_14080 [Streptomyces sp. NPDC048278]|uniref:hypothetical protein n=1 Tax=Streptomyces sp. NPDC048278 TaxID=3155809 RepID=UPI003415EEF4
MGYGALPGFFDKYSRRARLRPLLIALLPVALPVAVALPALPGAQTVWALLVCSGLPLCADQLGRSRGKRIEEGLFRSWGGKPSVQLLRWRGPNDRVRLAFLHEALQRVVGPTLRLPDELEEQHDPESADRVYDAAGLVLRARARALPGAVLLLDQNCEYGFRRNALGLRPYALSVTVAGLVAVAAWLAAPEGWWGRPATSLVVLLVVLEAGLVGFWAFLVRPSWVATAAWLYAERLLETCVVTDTGPPPPAN